MTRAGQHIALVSICCLIAAVILQSRSAMAGALVLAWLLALDGLLVAVACRGAERLSFTRRFESGAARSTVFCGRPTEVTLRISNTTPYILFGEARELVPHNLQVEGSTCFSFTLTPGATAALTYKVKAHRLGSMHFPGLSLRLFSPGGLWEVDRFIPVRGLLQAVPDIFGKHFLPTLRKDRNVLLRHGRHLQRRPGSGAELLSLREYREGDPPKTIAWRPSARRDRLLVKEFENEVPLRTRIVFQPGPRFFLDHGKSVTEAGALCARLARLLVEHRDLVEVLVPLPGRTLRTGEGLTRRHLLSVLGALGEAVCRMPVLPGPLTGAELAAVHKAALAHESALRKAASRLLARRLRLTTLSVSTGLVRQVVALFLASHYKLGVGAVELLERNPDLFGFFARRFAAPLGIIDPVPQQGAGPWALAQSRRWARALLETLSKLILHAKDSELFVLVADVPFMPKEEGLTLCRLLSRAAALNHRAVVLWPSLEDPRKLLGPAVRRALVEEAQLSRALRSRGIPVGRLGEERGFLLILRQLKQLQSQVAAW